MVGRVLAAVVLTVAVAAAGGCGDGGSPPDDSYVPSVAHPVPTETATATASPESRQPPKPAGSVPDGALGTWVGGLGSKEDFTFTVVSKDEYQLQHRATPAVPAFVEQGWIVGDSDQLLLRPVNVQGLTARERTVDWFRQPNDAGVDILVIHDPVFGELDYVRNDA